MKKKYKKLNVFKTKFKYIRGSRLRLSSCFKASDIDYDFLYLQEKTAIVSPPRASDLHALMTDHAPYILI